MVALLTQHSDPAKRRRSSRTGRQRGAWIYVSAAELAKAGVDLDGPPPEYRVWGGPRGGVVVSFYRREAETRDGDAD